MIQSGTQIKDTQFQVNFIITSVTEKRVNLDHIGAKYTTSTGRSSSKFFVGHETFAKYIAKGKWEIIK